MSTLLVLIISTDGKWVQDDYYEDRALEEATSKGFNAGDLVGDLPDPSMYTEANKLDGAGKGGGNAQGKGDRGAGLGLYRAGGPTTIFGGSGWGPYSDGPLNAVRKSLLNRDGLNEENWMHIAAQRTAEAGEEFAKIRKEALQVCGGVEARNELPIGEEMKKRAHGEGGSAGNGKRRKVRTLEDELPLGAYEPHTGIVHCKPILFSGGTPLMDFIIRQTEEILNLQEAAGKLCQILSLGEY